MAKHLENKMFELLTAIATDEHNEINGEVPVTREQAGSPWVDLTAWSKKLSWSEETTDILLAGLIKLEYICYVPAGQYDETAYVYLTSSGFKAWRKEYVKRAAPNRAAAYMTDSVEERYNTMAKKTAKKGPAKKAPAKKAPAKKGAADPGAPKKDAKPKMEKKHGVTHPRPGTICANIWAEFDKAAKKVDPSSRKNMIAKVRETEQFEAGTIGVQYRHWAIFNECYKKVRQG